MDSNIDSTKIEAVGSILLNPTRPLKERFRALFTLRNLGGQVAIEWINRGFSDSSELLKHECAYCLGQIGDIRAIPFLMDVLRDTKQEAIVRHEAAEALGAIGSSTVLGSLREYCDDPITAVAETCQIAVRRLEWLECRRNNEEELSENPFNSVDPAPPESVTVCDAETLRKTLMDKNLPLFQRYRAMFSLRNKADKPSVLSIAEGLSSPCSALFRHEVAYVLGQLQHEAAIPALTASLKNTEEHPMVRHESAEALGSIGTPACMAILKIYAADPERVVRESCEVALDMCDYAAKTDVFQYADTLAQVQHVKQTHNCVS
jgi:deoxyhypusine monooxygenase